jgi:hypothetical protein
LLLVESVSYRSAKASPECGTDKSLKKLPKPNEQSKGLLPNLKATFYSKLARLT